MTCQSGRDEPLTFKNRFYGVQELAGRIRLSYVAARTRAQGFSGNILGAIFANEQNFGFRGNLLNATSGFNPIQCG